MANFLSWSWGCTLFTAARRSGNLTSHFWLQLFCLASTITPTTRGLSCCPSASSVYSSIIVSFKGKTTPPVMILCKSVIWCIWYVCCWLVGSICLAWHLGTIPTAATQLTRYLQSCLTSMQSNLSSLASSCCLSWQSISQSTLMSCCSLSTYYFVLALLATFLPLLCQSTIISLFSGKTMMPNLTLLSSMKLWPHGFSVCFLPFSSTS